MFLICKLFGHHRSKKHARRHGEKWTSICIFCGAQLMRESNGVWGAR
jgi:hypothetical protein